MDEAVSDEDLVAYLDGEIDAARFARIDAMIRQDEALSARAAIMTLSAGQLREAFDDAMREPVPARLILAVRGGAVPVAPAGRTFGARFGDFIGQMFSRPRQWAPLAATAAVAGIVLGSSAGYLASTPAPGSTVLDTLAGAHNLLMNSADAGEPAAFDVPAGAEQQLPNDIHIPDMKPWGLSFRGARKTVVDGGRLAYQFYYTAAKKDPGPITVTVWKSNKEDMAPTFDRRDNVNVMYWRRAGHGYAIVGEADKGYMWNMSQDLAWQFRGS